MVIAAGLSPAWLAIGGLLAVSARTARTGYGE
jgi:hypothetical protein